MENQEKKENEEVVLSAEQLIGNIVALLETYLKILKLEVTSNTSAILAAAVLVVLMLFFGSFALLFFSICLAYALHYLLEFHLLWGFMIVGFLYLVLIGAFIGLRSQMQRIFEKIIQGLMEK